MAKYGSFKYSAEQYGTSANPSSDVTWVFLVDWNGDGVYDGTNEAQWLIEASVARGRQHYFQPSRDGGSNGFEYQADGSASLLFDDINRRYDPYNTSSPINPVLPMRRCQLQVMDNATGTVYPIFTGWILDIQPEGSNRSVRMTCGDGWSFLAAQKITTPAALFDKTIPQCIEQSLLTCAYPAVPAWQLNADSQPVRVFNLAGNGAGDIIQSLAAAGLGTFFFAKNGAPTFYPRSYASMTTHDIDQAVLHRELYRGQPWDMIANDVTVVAHRIIKKLKSNIWFLGDPLYVANSASATIRATYEPAVDIAMGKKSAYTNSNKTGTNLTSGFHVSADIHPSYTDFTVTNSSGSNGYLTELVLTGRTMADVSVEYNDTDATSKAAYGPLYFTLDSKFLQSRNYADSFSATILAFTKDPHKTPQIRIIQRPSVQYALDIQDKVALTSATLDITETFSVLGLEHTWNIETGQDVETTVWLAPVIFDDTEITPEPIDIEQPLPPEPETPPVTPPGGEIPPTTPPGTGKATAVVALGAQVYVTGDFGADSPAWVSKGFSGGTIIDADVCPYSGDFYYAATTANIYACNTLMDLAESTWTSIYSASTLGDGGAIIRVHAHPTLATGVFALASQGANLYFLNSLDYGATWQTTEVGEYGVASEFRYDSYSLSAPLIPGGTTYWKQGGVERPDNDETYNPWGVLASMESFKVAGTGITWYTPDPDVNDGVWEYIAGPAIEDSDYRLGVNVSLNAGQRAELYAYVTSIFGTIGEGETVDGPVALSMPNEEGRTVMGFASRVDTGPGTLTAYIVWRDAVYDVNACMDVYGGNPDIIYIGLTTKIIKSEDGGATWFDVYSSLGAYDLQVDPQLGGVIYFWSTDGNLYTLTAGALGTSLLTETPLDQDLRIARSPNTGDLWTLSSSALKRRSYGSWTIQDASVTGGVGLRAYPGGAGTQVVYLDATTVQHSENSGVTLTDKTGSGMSVTSPISIHLLE